MEPDSFLDVAEELAGGRTEAHWRSAVSRSYYALFNVITIDLSDTISSPRDGSRKTRTLGPVQK